MLRLIKNSLICLLLVLAAPLASAFSLLGPFAAWQDDLKMYVAGNIGGPMNLGEEYRWNLRTVYYAYDESFLNYFGSNGVAAIEAAINIERSAARVEHELQSFGVSAEYHPG
jgi:hypothetical protein